MLCARLVVGALALDVVGAYQARPLLAASSSPALASAQRSRPPTLQQDQQQRAVPKPFTSFLNPKVPEGQQPVVELQELKNGAFNMWASDDGYTGRLFQLYAATMLFLSLPISYITFDQLPAELPQLFLAANMGTFAFVMLPFVARLRVGWGFVSGRLKARKTYYEAQQTGLFATKDKATRMRDRLIEREEVAPALGRIDASILALVTALALTVGSGEALTIALGEQGPSTLKTLVGEDATRFENRLKGDNDFAKREQLRAQRKAAEDGSGLKPTYCDSRYYRILAGGNSQGGVGCGD
jgi:hypothetical protein